MRLRSVIPSSKTAGQRGPDDAKSEPNVRTVFRILASLSCDGSTAQGEPKAISQEALSSYLDSAAVPGVGSALWTLLVRESTRPDAGRSRGGSSDRTSAAANAPATELKLGAFLRGISGIIDCADDKRLTDIFTVLSSVRPSTLAGAPSASAAAPCAVPAAASVTLTTAHVAAVLGRAYALETGLTPTSDQPFRSAGSAAELASTAPLRDPATPGVQPAAQLFARWTRAQLPALSSVLVRHVEHLCDSDDAVGEAYARCQEVLRRKGGAIPGVALPLERVLQMAASQPEALHAILRRHAARERAAQEQTAQGRQRARAVSMAAGADGHATEGEEEGRDDVAKQAGWRGSGGAGGLLGREWRWLVGKALGLAVAAVDERNERNGGEGCGLQLLFSSQHDGRSLHTLAERLAGYTKGVLLVCEDEAGFVFCGWADGGLNPFPPSRADTQRYFGSERCALLRLQPSFAVCRSRRSLSASAQRSAQASAPAAPPPKGPEHTAGASDGNFVFFSNRRGTLRGIALGGTLRKPRLFLEPSLEAGRSCSSCDTYADGTLSVSDSFGVAVVEAWGGGGEEERLAQAEWKYEQEAAVRRGLRTFLVQQAESEADPAEEGRDCTPGVLGGVAKEDSWMLGLLGAGAQQWKRFYH